MQWRHLFAQLEYVGCFALVCVFFPTFRPSNASMHVVSTVFKGKHMAEVVSAFGTKVAVVGNHDFDLGLDQLIKLAGIMPGTTWLLSNVFDKRSGAILGGFKDRHVVVHDGVRLGFIGLVETEWIATLSMDTSFVEAQDPIATGTALAAKLREEDNVDVVIALTHSRMPNDVFLARDSKGIDLILGGHDHEVYHEFVNGIHVAKSGTEFRNGSLVTITIDPSLPKPKIDYELIPVTSEIPEDPAILEIVKHYTAEMEEKMKKPIGWVAHDMDARASNVRLNESDIGNLLVDIMRNEVESDFAILNSGTIRTDAIIPQGYFTMKDLFNLLPFEDLTCKTEITGVKLWKAMENGVSQWPKHEGRFPQVSGFSFTFNPNLAPGSRVVEITVNGKPIELEKTYTLACKPYISIDGKDGYDCFVGSKVLLPLEECLVNSVSFANYLRRLSVLQIWKNQMVSNEDPSLASPSQPTLNTHATGSNNASQAPIIDPAAATAGHTAKPAAATFAGLVEAHKTLARSEVPTEPTGHSIGKNWAKASIGPPRDAKLHHFQQLVHGVVDNLPRNLGMINPVVEGRIKRLDETAAPSQ